MISDTYDDFFLFGIVKQMLRDEEGKKLGLKVKEKTSVQKENDVKMSDAEVMRQPNSKVCVCMSIIA